MGDLIEKYDIGDPAVDELGVFENDELQSTYDAFVAEGDESVVSALRVGGAIEEVDLLDLQARIEATDTRDVQRVFENLKAGAENHLRAFVSVLGRDGVDYEPQYLSDAVFEEALDD